MTIQQQTDLNRRLFGRDIATVETLPGMDLGRDVVLGAAPGTDLALVEGADNLGQALTLALTTRLGDNVFDTAYGFDGIEALASETDAVLQRERIRIAVVTLLQRDSRVRRVEDVVLENDVLSGARAAGTMNVRVSFQTAAMTTATVDLRTVIPG